MDFFQFRQIESRNFLGNIYCAIPRQVALTGVEAVISLLMVHSHEPETTTEPAPVIEPEPATEPEPVTEPEPSSGKELATSDLLTHAESFGQPVRSPQPQERHQY